MAVKATLAGEVKKVLVKPGQAVEEATAVLTIRSEAPAADGNAVIIFSGLAAKLTISGGVAKDVLVVPITAVKGSAQSGVVSTKKADGSSEKHPVTIGLNDGTRVEIAGGLAKGDQILQFVPGPLRNRTAPTHSSPDSAGARR